MSRTARPEEEADEGDALDMLQGWRAALELWKAIRCKSMHIILRDPDCLG